jgi:hypothetical protein
MGESMTTGQVPHTTHTPDMVKKLRANEGRTVNNQASVRRRGRFVEPGERVNRDLSKFGAPGEGGRRSSRRGGLLFG